jgi:hypothetical protein
VASEPAAPDLSVVVVTPGGFDTVRKTVAHLRAQSVCDRMEVVVVAPDRERLGPVGEALDGFWGHQIVESGPITTTGRGLVVGYRATTAPVIGYVEEHSYPQPGWAEALIEAHKGPWAGVGVSLGNANPQTMVSWAMLFLDFASSIELVEPEEVTALPSHHTFYKREAILGYGEELHQLLEVEAVLQSALVSRGERLYMTSAARQLHVNVSRIPSMLKSQFYGGLQYAPLRIREEGFSIARRLGYAAAAPLIVVVQLRRILGHVARAGRARELLPRMLPMLLMGLVAEQLGETAGYLGSSQAHAPESRLTLELERVRHVREPDAEALR